MNAQVHNDSTVANIAGRDQRLTAFRAWGAAEKGMQAALVACFVIVARSGETSAAEIAEARGLPEASCKAYASTFNRAAKVQAVLGIGPTVKLIEEAAKGANGRAKEAVYDALGAALSGAKAEGISTATAAQGRKLVAASLATCAEKAADRKEAGKSSAKRGATGTQSHKMAEAATNVAVSKSWTEGVAGLRLIANTLNGAATPEGMEAQARAFLKAMGDAVEAGQPFLRKIAKA